MTRPKLCSASPGNTQGNRTSAKTRTPPYSRLRHTSWMHIKKKKNCLRKLLWTDNTVLCRRGPSSRGSWRTGDKTTRPPGRPVCVAPSTRALNLRRWWNEHSWTSQSRTRCTAWSPSASKVRLNKPTLHSAPPWLALENFTTLFWIKGSFYFQTYGRE